MNAWLSTLSFSWVDFLIVALLGVGFWRGRTRGISEELLDIIKWAVVLVAAAFLYEPGGRLLASTTSVFSLLSCYIFSYTVIVLLTFTVFSFIRKGVGAKLAASEAFGSGEYYLGMAAGVFRYGCIVLVGMAFLNARHHSPEEIAASQKYQLDNYGSSFFPTLPDLQQEVFTRSFAGRLAHQNLQVVLIRATAPEGKALGNDSDLGRTRERALYEVLDKKR